jgi:hypothetical protein
VLFNGTGARMEVSDNNDVLVGEITNSAQGSIAYWDEYQAPIGKYIMVMIKVRGKVIVSTPPFSNKVVKGRIADLLKPILSITSGYKYYIRFMDIKNKEKEEKKINEKKRLQDEKDSCVRLNIGQSKETIRKLCNL